MISGAPEVSRSLRADPSQHVTTTMLLMLVQTDQTYFTKKKGEERKVLVQTNDCSFIHGFQNDKISYPPIMHFLQRSQKP